MKADQVLNESDFQTTCYLQSKVWLKAPSFMHKVEPDVALRAWSPIQKCPSNSAGSYCRSVAQHTHAEVTNDLQLALSLLVTVKLKPRPQETQIRKRAPSWWQRKRKENELRDSLGFEVFISETSASYSTEILMIKVKKLNYFYPVKWQSFASWSY